jgi:hypothetical protein
MDNVFKLYYRLTNECSWHEAWPTGPTEEKAAMALLLGLKTIYRVSGHGIEIAREPNGELMNRVKYDESAYPYGYGMD